jgi:flagellin FlaB
MAGLPTERSQVGIGTLVVFIALVLVASIAAGVLINTAGFLQTQSEKTGQQSTAQVANGITVVGETGGVANVTTEYDSGTGSVVQSQNFICEIQLTVQKSPGSGNLNLTEMSIQYLSSDSVGTLVHVTEADDPALDAGINLDTVTSSNAGEEGYFVTPVVAETAEDAVLTDASDRYRIVIPVGLAYLESQFNHVIGVDTSGPIDGDSLEEDAITNPDHTTITYDDVLGEPISGELGLDNTDLGFLASGEPAQLVITTADGAQRTVRVAAPESLSGEAGTEIELSG